MRLSDILSNEPSEQFAQIEGFLGDKKIKSGTSKKIDVGVITLSFFCKNCKDSFTFSSPQDNKPPLNCVVISNQLVSIDCTLKCPRCGCVIPTWFLVESKEDMFLHAVDCRILKRRENMGEIAMHQHGDAFGKYTPLFEKANVAYREDLGTGAIVYLRKAFEQVICDVADGAKISRVDDKGARKRFKDLLNEVEAKCKIIPHEFAKNKYKLFGELSNVLHGDYDEELGLKRYENLRRLVVGVIENVKNKRELAGAAKALGLNDGARQ